MGYQRSQMISVLWTVLRGPFPAPVALKDVPKGFARRVGNLLDRGVGITPERRTGQKGVFQEYEAADVIEMGIALRLQNVGMPQQEIVNFVVAFRSRLRARIAALARSAEPGNTATFLVLRPEGPGLSSYVPQFVRGPFEWARLGEELSGGSREGIVVEINDLVSAVHKFLDEADTANRGRR